MNEFLQRTLPLQGTDVAAHWDNLYIFLFWISLVFFVIVIVPMCVFAIKYRAKPGVKPSTNSHNTNLEIIWTAVPTVLLMIIFAWGWIMYKEMVDSPRDAYTIRVIAKSWQWNFQYDDGRITNGQVFVPMNKPVKLIMTSETKDVIHSFFVPDFRIKKDVVPGAYSHVAFTAKVPGQHQVLCAEYCGTGHSAMLAKLVVLDDEQWKLWLWGKDIKLPPAVGLGSLSASADQTQVIVSASANPPKSLADRGKLLMESKGCVACHTNDGSIKIGPSFKGLFNHEVMLSNGSTIVADENYIKESIEKPQAKIVKGYEAIMMPSYAGQLDTTEMNAVIEYMKSLN